MFALGMPATLMYIATTFFLEGIGRPKPGMVIALSANLLNAGINWLLITGEMGAPAMGAAGAALGITITRWVMLFALVGYALAMRDAAGYGLRVRPSGIRTLVRKLLRIGAPLSIAAGLESACFSAVATFAGWLGEAPLAAYQIAHGAVTFVFMLAIGLSTATSIRVANAVGRHDRAGMAAAGWTGIGMIAAFAAVMGLAIAFFSGEITALYSRDASVLALAEPLLAIVAVMVVVDGIQAVTLGALRATGDVIFPTITYGLCFWALGMPVAYLLAFEAGAGVAGLLWGLFAALVCALLALVWRFILIARRPVTPL
jgi:MATE family multidrug resistance protein